MRLSEIMLKKKLVQAYKLGSEELKKGNPGGFRVIENTLDNMTHLTDDKEVVLQQAIIATIKRDYISDQENYEGGKEFLKKMGAILGDIGKAYHSDDTATLNKLYREFIWLMKERWRKYLYLQPLEEE